MKTFRLIFILLLTLGFLSSCSNKGEKVLIAQPMDPQVENLLSDLNNLEENISEGMVLRAATAQEKRDIYYLLKRVRVLSMRLGQFSDDQRATRALYKTLLKLQNLDLTNRDQGMFTNTLTTLRMTIDHYSSIQGINIFGPRDNSIVFFSEDFKKGLGEFTIEKVEGGPTWTLKFYEPKDQHYVEAKSFKAGPDGSNLNGVTRLVSPIFDLKDKRNVTFEIEQAYRFVNSEDSIKIQIKEENPEAKWNDVKIENLPSGNDWNAVKSERVKIPSNLKDKKVKISFLYESTEGNNPAWQIHLITLREEGEKNE